MGSVIFSLPEVKQKLIPDSLKVLPPVYRSPSVINGLTGIGLAESGYRTRTQVGGPALGFWQMEPATHDDIWKTYLSYRPLLAHLVSSSLMGTSPSAKMLVVNDRYACLMARVRLLRVPEPLPLETDAEGWANYWKEYYNTSQGKGTLSRVIPLFQEAIST